MVITWDEAKQIANLAKHGLDFVALDADFFADAIIGRARPPRFVAIGRLPSGAAVTVIFALLGREGLSVVSMRPASRKERNRLNAR
jgi:uncharacterized DUF497 family protein